MGKYLIRIGNLIDVISKEVRKDMGVLVEGDTITEVKPYVAFSDYDAGHGELSCSHWYGSNQNIRRKT